MRPAVLLTLLLLVAGCQATRTVEPLPGETTTWNRGGYDRAKLSVVALVAEQDGNGDAFGAGIVYDDQGHILTAHHVVEGASRVLLLLSGGYTLRAEVVSVDPVTDFALLRAETMLKDRMQPARLAHQTPVPGDLVWSLGNPFGTSRFGGAPSVGHGVVSAVQRTYYNDNTGRLYLDAIQHDAPTNPGNSGGGIFNERGELIGMNALITTMRENTGDSGVAFAVPAGQLKQRAEAMLRGEPISHGWFGARQYKQATEIYPQGYGRLRAVFGPLDDVGPAGASGVLPGDVIIKIDGEEVFGIHEVLSIEDAMVPGQMVTLTINRAGREFPVVFMVGERPWPYE